MQLHSTLKCSAATSAHVLRGVRFRKPRHSHAGHIRALVLVLAGAAAALVVVAKVKVSTPQADRIARHVRLRKKVSGTTARPRLGVFRSNKHLYAQVIDDTKSCTLVPASTMHKSLSKDFEYSAGRTIEVAQKIGEVIARSCLEKGITKVVFDRGGFLYHGGIKALADAARMGLISESSKSFVYISRITCNLPPIEQSSFCSHLSCSIDLATF